MGIQLRWRKEGSADNKTRIERAYSISAARKRLFILAVAVIVVIIYICSLMFGPVRIPFDESFKIIVNMIAPGTYTDVSRIHTIIITRDMVYKSLLCLIAGFGLGIAGTMMQGILRNPLVSPFTLGVSSAASFGAAVGIVLMPVFFESGTVYYTIMSGVTISNTQIMRMIFAFIFGMLSITIVLLMTRRTDISKSTVILAGVIISYLFQAGVSFAKYLSDDDALRELTYWIMGSMSEGRPYVIMILFPALLCIFLVMEWLAPKINVLGAGDEVASSLGLNVARIRNIGLLVAAAMTSAITAFTGVIGFIGLMAPHICRLFIGNDTRYLLPASGLMGSAILLVSYIVSLTIIPGQVLPIGIFMDILGGIFFVWLITRRKKEVRI